MTTVRPDARPPSPSQPPDRRSRRIPGRAIGVGALVLAAACAFVWLGATGGAAAARSTEAGGDRPAASPAASSAPGPRHPVLINRPAGPPRVPVHAGGAETVACSTCHAVRDPNPANRAGADLDEFHAGLTVAHGTLSCLACHDPTDYDRLRLADGTPVGFPDVMTLCGQCHGPQARNYERGAHGGMNGYWDLTRGPRTRNNCIDCHDPHAPAFPRMVPTFKPRDRFLTPEAPHAPRPDHAEDAP